MTVTVCFHGAESTGKSVLAQLLERTRGIPWVREYGREYAETHGTAFTMADLLAIAEGHAAATRTALALKPPLLVLDTDPLMTAAWAQMLFGEAPAALFAYPKADHYLLFDAGVPWVGDGTRLFGTATARAAFAQVCEDVLVRAGVGFVRVAGSWEERERAVLGVIEGLGLG